MGRAAAALTTPAWSFACPDWGRACAGRSLVPDLPLDRAEGDRPWRSSTACGCPTSPASRPWPRPPATGSATSSAPAFGSLDAATGARHVAEDLRPGAEEELQDHGRRGIALTALLMNERPNAELQLVGPTQEIAQLAFDQAWGMIEADPDGYLQKRFLVRDHVKTIEDRLTGAELKIKTFDMKVMTGSKPVVVLVDELHIMSAYQLRQPGHRPDRGGNMLANPESLLIFITTQSDQPPAGVFKQELQYARGVRDGRITDQVRMLPMLYEFPEAMQTGPDKPWMNPATWPMVLPNLGRSITVERLIADFKRASEKGEEEIRRWASQHLNVEIGLALHADRWRGADYWACRRRDPGLPRGADRPLRRGGGRRSTAAASTTSSAWRCWAATGTPTTGCCGSGPGPRPTSSSGARTSPSA
jgi:phage terminase large subunit-like protein